MSTNTKPRITGVGGVFFKSPDPQALLAWYADRLGLEVTEWGGAAFDWRQSTTGDNLGSTAFSINKADTKHYEAPFMINYRVYDIEGLIAGLREKGDRVDEKGIESYPYGKFAWTWDPDGNKIELWEPIDRGFSESAV